MSALSWGSGATGVLLDGSLEDRTSPVACSLLSSASENLFFAPGGSHVLAVYRSQNGQTQYLTIGGNDFRQLGDPNYDLDQGGPLDISRFFPSDCAFVHAASGWNHTLVLLADGSIYAWGENSHGQCGFNPSSAKFIKQPTRVNIQIGEDRIVTVACGMRHSAFVTACGAAYCFGEGKFGQLGSGEEKSTHVPSKVLLPPACFVASASLGSRHSVFLMNDGDVYVTGCNRFGQCAFPQATSKLVTPAKLPVSGIKLAAAGWNFTLLFHGEQKMLSCGRNNYGQLGVGYTSNSHFGLAMIDLSSLLDGEVKQVACGSEHSVLLSASGSLYAFGWNEHGQLGLGDTEFRSAPTILALRDIASISSGGGFSIAVTKGHDLG